VADVPGFDQRSAADTGHRRFRLRHLWYLLLLIPFPAVLVPTIYTRETPKLAGIPFFYWYQLAWIIVGGILTAIVYFATREK
jgi:Protein of unknown function (DUF3311)